MPFLDSVKNELFIKFLLRGVSGVSGACLGSPGCVWGHSVPSTLKSGYKGTPQGSSGPIVFSLSIDNIDGFFNFLSLYFTLCIPMSSPHDATLCYIPPHPLPPGTLWMQPRLRSTGLTSSCGGGTLTPTTWRGTPEPSSWTTPRTT